MTALLKIIIVGENTWVVKVIFMWWVVAQYYDDGGDLVCGRCFSFFEGFYTASSCD